MEILFGLTHPAGGYLFLIDSNVVVVAIFIDLIWLDNSQTVAEMQTLIDMKSIYEVRTVANHFRNTPICSHWYAKVSQHLSASGAEKYPQARNHG